MYQVLSTLSADRQAGTKTDQKPTRGKQARAENQETCLVGRQKPRPESLLTIDTSFPTFILLHSEFSVRHKNSSK